MSKIIIQNVLSDLALNLEYNRDRLEGVASLSSKLGKLKKLDSLNLNFEESLFED